MGQGSSHKMLASGPERIHSDHDRIDAMEALLRCHQTEILAMKGELADKEKRIGVLESIVIVLAKECGFRLEHI
eukprot:204080-Rhodomonas_salina.1